METVQIKGQKTLVKLGDADYVARGGEATVYEQNGVIYKIYHDPKRMIPPGKIDELQVLDRPNIIRPLDILVDPKRKQKPVGFTMAPVPNKVFLCEFFVTDFWDDHNVAPATIQALSEDMIDTIAFTHDRRCLIIDLNEFNILSTETDYTKSFFIDTNSYGTPSYPATAINLGIKDWHAKKYSPETDWFSTAILICQLFLGIHPFLGGSNPAFPKTMKKNPIDYVKKRVLANVSIFHNDIKLPPVVRDFDIVPPGYMDWFLALFEKGIRVPPPSVAGVAGVLTIKIDVIKSTNTFIISELLTLKEKIRAVRYVDQKEIIRTTKHVYINQKEYPVRSPKAGVILLNSRTPILAEVINNVLHLTHLLRGEEIKTIEGFAASDILVFENNLFAWYKSVLTEISLTEFQNGTRVVAACGDSRYLGLPKSSRVFDGFVYQDIMGRAFFLIPSISQYTGKAVFNQFAIPEVDGTKILSGKYDGGVLVLAGNKNQTYIKFVICFGSDGKYHVRSEETMDYPLINFVTLDSGTCVMINNDGAMELFHSSMKSTGVNKIEDPQIRPDMILSKDGARVLFHKDKRLFSLKSK